MSRKRKRKALRVYHQYRYRPFTFFLSFSMFWMALTFLCSLFFVPLAFATANNDSLWIGYAIPAPLTLAVAVIVSSFIHLAIHEDALEYHTIFHHIIIPWENLSHLEVHESDDAEGGISYTHYLYLKDHNSKRLNVGEIVPIRHQRNDAGYFIDVDDLLTTPFGKDLLHYAPHVIDAAREAENRARAS